MLIEATSKLVHLILLTKSAAKLWLHSLVHAIAHLLLLHVVLHPHASHSTHGVLWHGVAHHRHEWLFLLALRRLIVVSENIKSPRAGLCVWTERIYVIVSTHLNIV